MINDNQKLSEIYQIGQICEVKVLSVHFEKKNCKCTFHLEGNSSDVQRVEIQVGSIVNGKIIKINYDYFELKIV